MAFKDKKIRIEAFGPAGKPAAEAGRIDESLLRLARLIGRQMAREDFERLQPEARRGCRPGARMSDPSEQTSHSIRT